MAGILQLEFGSRSVSGVAPRSNPGVSASGKRKRFPRNVRLLRHADFERVYKRGRRHFAPHLTAFYLGRGQGEGLCVGFTVSKLLGGAVQRNRMRRRLREAVRLHWPDFQAPVDIVINPKKSLLTADFSELEKEVGELFQAVQKLAERQNAKPDPGK